MSEQPQHELPGLPRREFMKATGAVTGAGLLGIGATGGAAGAGIDDRLLNWRTIEARKVWDRGYRGRPDRALALTDTGISARHADLGPWNGVVAGTDDDGNFVLADVDEQDVEFPDPEAEVTITTLATLQGSGTVGPGASDAGAAARDVIVEFVPSVRADEQADDADQDLAPTQLDGTLTWTPQRQDNELFLEKLVDGEWQQVGAGTDFNPLSGEGERVVVNDIDPDATYRWVIETYASAAATYEFSGEVNNRQGIDRPEIEFDAPTTVDPFAEIPDDPEEVTPDTPKTICWYNERNRYSQDQQPRDHNGHGSHVSGIMAGSGRGSSIEFSNTEVERPGTVLLPTDFVEYDVNGVPASSTVFVSALGDNVRIQLLYDGEVVHESPLREDSIIVDEPAVHDSGTDSYTVRVKPYETQAATDEAAERVQSGTPTTGRLHTIALGSYVPPANAEGARTAGGNTSVHTGLAPAATLVGLEGLGEPSLDLGEYAEQFSSIFNVRAVNMSWGYLLGAPLGGLGGALDDTPAAIKRIAEGGILTVAAAGNAMTPANGNGAPGAMDEAISVTSTGPLDDLASYSSGGIGSVDEDEDDVDRTPDVSAPGGDWEHYGAAAAVSEAGLDYNAIPDRLEWARSVLAADPDTAYEDEDAPPRDYLSIPGTSMASPYVCGTSALVAQAMEEDAPASIALPEPADTGFADVMRMKQPILAAASETVFTAGPYHAAKTPPSTPVYTHGGRDPYEGFGRVNPDAAVDAVSRNLLGTDHDLGDDTYRATSGESVGTFIPEDSRAVAGYVHVPGGDLEVSVEFTDYSGSNSGLTTDTPHLDLFVYDAENPADNGEPNIVASTQAERGSGSVSISVDRGTREEPNDRTFYVVAKIVNIPGVVNGFDVQANFDLDVTFDPAEAFGPIEVDLDAAGSRSDEATVFTAGQTERIEVTIEAFNDDLADQVRIVDHSPWDVDKFGDVESYDAETGEVDLGTVEHSDLPVTKTYFAEAPEETNSYEFGEAEARAVDPNDFGDDPDREQGSTTESFGGTDTNYVVGVSQES